MGNLEEILANKQFPLDFQNTGSMIAWRTFSGDP
jgi:hypothetical protein